MLPGHAAVTDLVARIDAHLATITAEREGIDEVRVALARFRSRIAARDLPRLDAQPACGHLEAAMSLARQQAPATLVAAISAALPYLDWVSYGAYPAAEIGPRFPTSHAFASLAAVYDPDYALDFDLGLFLIAPHTLYRDHRHKAAELYLPLSGPSWWRFGTADSWQPRESGEPVWNAPFAPHATRVEEAPFLCLYSWSRDVAFPAQVIPAGDWQEIEGRLAQIEKQSGGSA